MTPPRRKIIGIVAVTFAFLGFLAVLLAPSIQETLFPQPAIEDRIADTAVRIRDRVKARLKGEPADAKPSRETSTSAHWSTTVALALAGLGFVGGCVSYLRREDHRYAYVAWGTSVLALAWQALMLAIGALILCAIIVAVSSWLGLDF